MQPHDVPPQLLHPEPVPLDRRQSLSSTTFWALMDRWKVPSSRALCLIGHRDRRDGCGKPKFRMSEEQAKVLSCLLEIDLTLAVTGLQEDRLHKPSPAQSLAGASPLDAMGECDPSRAAVVLWSLNQVARRRSARAA